MRDALPKALAGKIHKQAQAVIQTGTTTVSQSQLELFLFFMKTGMLPWWAERDRADVLEMAVAHLLKQQNSQLQMILAAELANPRFLRRLIGQLGDSQLLEMLRLLMPIAQESVVKTVQELITAVAQTDLALKLSHAQRRRVLWSTLFHAALLWRQSPQPQSGQLYATLRLELDQQFDLSPEIWASMPTHLQPNDDDNHSTQSPPQSPIDKRLLPDLSDGETVVTAQPKATIPKIEEPHEVFDKPSLHFSVGQETYIDNAGLVLLWPFLATFFNRMALIADTQFLNQPAQQRAVGLLQLLAGGETTFPEYMLPLNKVLCGMKVEAVYAPDVPLGVDDVVACDGLLTAVIQQAPILNNMSLSGFRGSFLLRQAVLRSRDGSWLLQVERETYDVVLDQFPWQWGWVKLPWMPVPMRVEW